MLATFFVSANATGNADFVVAGVDIAAIASGETDLRAVAARCDGVSFTTIRTSPYTFIAAGNRNQFFIRLTIKICM